MADKPILSPEREKFLVEAVQSGDRGALGELLGAYQKRIYHVCLRMVSHPEDAADLTQEALMRAVKHVDGFRRGSRFSTWLMRIAMNLSISHLRKTAVRRAVSLERPAGAADQAASLKDLVVSDREPSPTSGVEKQEQMEKLGWALGRLDPPLRSIILLRDLQGMDYQQIAEVLSVPVGTVKSRLFRARLALRRALDEPGGPKNG